MKHIKNRIAALERRIRVPDEPMVYRIVFHHPDREPGVLTGVRWLHSETVIKPEDGENEEVFVQRVIAEKRRLKPHDSLCLIEERNEPLRNALALSYQ